MTPRLYDVVIVGAGPAGLGCAIVLKHLGVRRVLVVDRFGVGASFARWPAEMRLITPSFTINQFGPPDLNAIAIRTSPAFTLGCEHPTGRHYARYLKTLAKHFGIRVRKGVDVTGLARHRRTGHLKLHTNGDPVVARTVIWATGEFQYPRRSAFPGADLCLHNSDVGTWSEWPGTRAVVIGGYESGIDAAVHLVGAGRHATVLDGRNRWDERTTDPSAILSPFTADRLRTIRDTDRLTLCADATVRRVERRGGTFTVHSADGRVFTTDGPPILATGFFSGASVISERFEWRDGTPLLTADDESTLTPNLFVAGPSVRHDAAVFCFIYKFRQRFAVVARAIGVRLGVDVGPLELYRRHGMYLDDLSCCQEQCAC